MPLVFGSVQHWLDKFNGVLLPIYLLGLALAVGLAIYNYGYSNDWLSKVPATGAGLVGCIRFLHGRVDHDDVYL
jgi:cytosine permease